MNSVIYADLSKYEFFDLSKYEFLLSFFNSKKEKRIIFMGAFIFHLFLNGTLECLEWQKVPFHGQNGMGTESEFRTIEYWQATYMIGHLHATQVKGFVEHPFFCFKPTWKKNSPPYKVHPELTCMTSLKFYRFCCELILIRVRKY